ncbi:protein FAR1-RELATED SEQUENCE 5-like [Carya illinoinensis]|uniref:protein FAR1-RELATED SEQUENCE 5-like n=1 Tax=Carya illinoinensis TaxID=32201 RepID=UPI001C71A82E|nr:protein FAR1-RELATED SEQUENCE 5-like [Carya illinoinensis]
MANPFDEDFNPFDHSFEMPPYMPYTPPTNPEDLTQEAPPESTAAEFEKNVGCSSRISDDSVHDADEMVFDINEDLEGTTDVQEDEVRVDAPRSSMEFASVKELTVYYKHYAKQQGFGVWIQRTRRDDDRTPVYVTVGCAHGGKYQPKNKNIHNHVTVSPKKTRLLRSHKVLDEYSQRVLDLNDQAGIRLNKNFFSLVVDAGGFENFQFQEKDCQNYIDKARHLQLGKGGGDALNQYFKRMRDKNDGFVSVMDVDDEGRLRNVFWADARSRAAYEYFGDVVTFDTTYLTNRYRIPFAPFVGVNHHG